MRQVYVKFDNAEQVKNFINIVDKIDTRFNMGSDKNMIDAKSIIGICALDLKEPQKLCFDSDDSGIMEKLSPFLVTE